MPSHCGRQRRRGGPCHPTGGMAGSTAARKRSGQPPNPWQRTAPVTRIVRIATRALPSTHDHHGAGQCTPVCTQHRRQCAGPHRHGCRRARSPSGRRVAIRILVVIALALAIRAIAIRAIAATGAIAARHAARYRGFVFVSVYIVVVAAAIAVGLKTCIKPKSRET